MSSAELRHDKAPYRNKTPSSSLETIGRVTEKLQLELELEVKRARSMLDLAPPPQKARGEQVPFEWIEDMARRLAFTTRAPPEWHFANARPLPPVFAPPCPQLDAMKKGVLYLAATPEILVRNMMNENANNVVAEFEDD